MSSFVTMPSGSDDLSGGSLPTDGSVEWTTVADIARLLLDDRLEMSEASFPLGIEMKNLDVLDYGHHVLVDS